MAVRDQIKALIQLASGVAEVPRQQAEQLARDLAERTGSLREGAGSVTALAEEIVRRSRDNVQLLRTLVSGEIKRQVKALGLATRDDLDRVQRRVRELEQRVAASSKTAARTSSRTSKPKPKPKSST